MANQIDVNKLKQAEATSSIAKDLITQAIEQSAANQVLAQEALKKASEEIAQTLSLVSQVETTLKAQSSQSE
ncbi:hypothetical protein [Fredinandcohnia quinoae]|uniref:Uncharacterized protein n=1 Tax=Fredinandcohnia quinoae TaxID=2918902 RepID=A0AAW5EBD8_9BACI|nr:hypothetical protein [Fredinandcohnia sp. SECRCQ15]MCH1627282.1 hypothetical protein [Fredinandcohnia sp. SECRCQ15]